MPKRNASGIKYLTKHHDRACTKRTEFLKCDCAWRGQYKGHIIVLAKWSGEPVPARATKKAEEVLRRLIAAIDASLKPGGPPFSKDREQPLLGSTDQRLKG